MGRGRASGGRAVAPLPLVPAHLAAVRRPAGCQPGPSQAESQPRPTSTSLRVLEGSPSVRLGASQGVVAMAFASWWYKTVNRSDQTWAGLGRECIYFAPLSGRGNTVRSLKGPEWGSGTTSLQTFWLGWGRRQRLTLLWYADALWAVESRGRGAPSSARSPKLNGK